MALSAALTLLPGSPLGVCSPQGKFIASGYMARSNRNDGPHALCNTGRCEGFGTLSSPAVYNLSQGFSPSCVRDGSEQNELVRCSFLQRLSECEGVSNFELSIRICIIDFSLPSGLRATTKTQAQLKSQGSNFKHRL